MEISFLLFKLVELQKKKKTQPKLENNYVLYDKKLNTYSSTCTPGSPVRLDVYTDIVTHLCVGMYIYWRCCFV